ncbi:4-diphosphocytidyl-2-C-methyl-D-erythritol kinase [Lactarius quietus]|nr:4-diphosphocytidyl-2-C-methyl-D-erythritol kinase [Lactarius quietus]
MTQITVNAPAKLNLFVHVTGRRPNGYHDIQTVFQILDYSDELHITPRDDDRLSLSCVRDCSLSLIDATTFADLDTPNNLILRAARTLQEASNTQNKGADIILRKRIPVGGGHGGGSADAAATLIALNHLWGLGLSRAELATIGGRLGADIPAMTLARSAWAEGTGEVLTPLALPRRVFLVIYPSVCALTGPVFSHPDLVRSTPRISREDYENGTATTRNDLQPVAEALYPSIAAAVRWLSQFSPAYMSGTGSCVFAGFDNRDDAGSVLKQVPEPWGAFVATGVNEWDYFRGDVA